MGMSPVPAQIVFESDQGYAHAQERLNDFLVTLVKNLKERPKKVDAVPWAASVELMLVYLRNDPDGEYTRRVVELWQAAMYQLARKKMVEN